jgi:hypothetical protein
MNTIWICIAIRLLQLLRWYIRKMTPAARASFKQAIKDMPMMDELDPNHGMGGR